MVNAHAAPAPNRRKKTASPGTYSQHTPKRHTSKRHTRTITATQHSWTHHPKTPPQAQLKHTTKHNPQATRLKPSAPRTAEHHPATPPKKKAATCAAFFNLYRKKTALIQRLFLLPLFLLRLYRLQPLQRLLLHLQRLPPRLWLPLLLVLLQQQKQ